MRAESYQDAKNRFIRFLKKLTDKSWLSRIFQPRCVSDLQTEPGVLMIQIDGLSYQQIQKAFSKNRLPYLRRLSENRGYHLKRFYSGMPSTTAAVQAELFYGVKSSVPAISFYDREQEKKEILLFPVSANNIARQLESLGKPLLKGGTSYSNIFTGGAETARYCIQTMKLRSMRHLASSVKMFIILALQPSKFFRMWGYGVLETGLALYDFFRGVGKGRDFFKELKFVPTRILICILLRELIRIRVKMDLARGVRIVHASFLGYDEQSHRRGPDSAFAHWTLKGIDAVIRDIHHRAKKSKCLKYQLIVYSDHGQELAVSFEKRFGKTLEEAIKEAVMKANRDTGLSGSQEKRENRILRRRARGMFFKQTQKDEYRIKNGLDGIMITALGPIGHVYLGSSLASGDKARMAEALVNEAKIPMVLFTSKNRVIAQNKKGCFDPEVSFSEILGEDHPLSKQTARDLVEICHHPDAGDFVISGWTPEEQPMTFAVENGAHGGPGREETSGFVLIPQSMDKTDEVFRPLDLRALIFRLLEKDEEKKSPGNMIKGLR
ncbi:MAG: hypothetical protein R6U27_00880 [Desulfobacterales bacterium]